jgi:hypothetical protein
MPAWELPTQDKFGDENMIRAENEIVKRLSKVSLTGIRDCRSLAQLEKVLKLSNVR